VDEEVAHEEEEEEEIVTDVAEERWGEILERIGAYAAGELSGEEAREAEQLILKNAEVRRLVDSYARMLTLLRVIGEELPEAPEAVIDHAVRQALAKKARACKGHAEHTQKGKTRCSKGRLTK
jgi:anti-sigma-K factor RskA